MTKGNDQINELYEDAFSFRSKALSIRLPIKLHGLIVEAARANHRSVSTEVILRLIQSFRAS